MADPNEIITQLGATRAAAAASSVKVNSMLNQEICKPISDPQVMAVCADTIAQNDKTIQKCDENLVAAVLARADVDVWLSTLGGFTAQMSAQATALTDDIDTLNAAKSVATAIAGMLVLLA